MLIIIIDTNIKRNYHFFDNNADEGLSFGYSLSDSYRSTESAIATAAILSGKMA